MSTDKVPSPDESPPAVLFKFRRFPSLEGMSDERREAGEHLRRQIYGILRDGQLPLARPDSFDDPFEFRPAVVPIETARAGKL